MSLFWEQVANKLLKRNATCEVWNNWFSYLWIPKFPRLQLVIGKTRHGLKGNGSILPS